MARDSGDETGDSAPPAPASESQGTKHVKKGTRGADYIIVAQGDANSPEPLRRGPYAKITGKGRTERVPLKGNPALE